MKKIGFGQELPFPISVTSSQYSNEEHISTEAQLADSGYGQGQMLGESYSFGQHLHCTFE